MPSIERNPLRDPKVELGQVSPPDDVGMLNAQQAAEYLGVSVHKVSRLVRMGHLPAYVPTTDRRQRLFERADLDAFLPRAADIGNDWEGPTPDNLRGLEAVHTRLVALGVPPGSNGYDLAYLINVVELRGWAWSVEKEFGPWQHDERKLPQYEAVVNRGYRPGIGGLSVRSHAWKPEHALARSIDQLLQDEDSGASRLFRHAALPER